jgi:hypothetical protein
MKIKLGIFKSLILFFLFQYFFSISLLGQNWFPLKVGNRWDYLNSTYCHGGYVSNDTISVEVIGDTILGGKRYYTLSHPFPFLDVNLLRIENDSLYYFNVKDSSDCLIYAFNLTLGTKYYSCKFDSVYYYDQFYITYFGYPDTQQAHILNSETQSYYFSKKFGLYNAFSFYNSLCDYQFNLSGCIISGITYGQILSSVENKKENQFLFNLKQNYPNPFNPSTIISYQIDKRSLITIRIFDALGREVATLINKEESPGVHRIEFNSEKYNLSSGVYFYELKLNNDHLIKKMIVIK